MPVHALRTYIHSRLGHGYLHMEPQMSRESNEELQDKVAVRLDLY